MAGIALLSVIFIGACSVVAAPMSRGLVPRATSPHGICTVSTANVNATLPSGQSILTGQATAPSFIGLGVGAQSYTCNSTSGSYDSTGAIAQLFDMSCMLNDTASFANAATIAFNIWSSMPPSITAVGLTALHMPSLDPFVLGQQIFVHNGSAIHPVWDFSTSQNSTSAFVIAQEDGRLPAPQSATDLPWLQLHGVDGELASTVYQLATRGGQPPVSCKAGDQDVSVKYAAQYWFFGTSFSS